MRLLVDENLPPRLADLLTEYGHDGIHVEALDARGATDSELIDRAAADE